MASRPPRSIIVALASATILGLTGIAVSGWGFFRSLSAVNRETHPGVMSLFGIVAVGFFIERTLRRRRSVRIPAIAIALPCAVIFAVSTFCAAVAPGMPDRSSALVALGSVTLLEALIAVPLLRESARTWLN